MELTLIQTLNPNPKTLTLKPNHAVYMLSHGKPFVQYFPCFD